MFGKLAGSVGDRSKGGARPDDSAGFDRPQRLVAGCVALPGVLPSGRIDQKLMDSGPDVPGQCDAGATIEVNGVLVDADPGKLKQTAIERGAEVGGKQAAAQRTGHVRQRM